MKLKTVILASIALIAFASPASLYFVSGGDFRIPDSYWFLQTTESNQTIQVNPKLESMGKWQSTSSYSIKFDRNNEQQYTKKEDVPAQSMTFENPGLHKVSVYDPSGSLYKLQFTYMTNLISAKIKVSSFAKTSELLSSDVSIKFQNCPNLESVEVYGDCRPEFYAKLPKQFARNSKNLKHFSWPHMDEVVEVGDQAFYTCIITNNIILPSCTNIGTQAFALCQAERLEIPNIEILGSNSFANWLTTKPLKTIRIGRKLRTWGGSCFHSQTKVSEIEFVSSSDDWIQEWNNHPILPIQFGIATPIDGEPNKASLNLSQKPSDYIDNIQNPQPKTLIRINNQ